MSRKLPYSRETWKVSIPSHLAARVLLRLPSGSGKTAYAVRSRLIAQLLEEWVEDVEKVGGEEPEPMETL
jgi:hypothetical protein